MKRITPHFDRSSGRLETDYEASYDGNVIGFYPTHHTAEIALDDYVLDLCAQGLIDQPLAALDPDDGPVGPEPDDIPGADPSPGRAIARQWHRTPRIFLNVLRQLDPAAWLPLAEAYSEWRGCSAQHTLDIWLLAVQGTNVPANARVNWSSRLPPIVGQADASAESFEANSKALS